MTGQNDGPISMLAGGKIRVFVEMQRTPDNQPVWFQQMPKANIGII